LNAAEQLEQVTTAAIGAYLVAAICFSVGFSTHQPLGFPALNGASSANSTFVFLSLVAFLFFVDFDKSYSLGFAFFFNDFFKFFFQAILFCSVICFFYVSKEFVEIKKILSFEYDLIICFSLFGLILVNVCDDFLTLYLSIELQSLAFYTLAAFNRKSEYSAEASVKYFILGGFSSGLLLLGFALLYASFGSTNFEAIERTNFLIHSLMVLSGCCFISVSILFKLGTFPFHN